MKELIVSIVEKVKKFSVPDFLFGKTKTYRVDTGFSSYEVAARSYSLKKDGYAVLRSGFSRVGTFLNVKLIIEV